MRPQHHRPTRAGGNVLYGRVAPQFHEFRCDHFFLEILPRLRPGVLVHIHDIFLPLDYWLWWLERFCPHRYWSEQYLLAASLLAGHSGYDVILPNHYVSLTPRIASTVDGFWTEPRVAEVSRGGSSFWIQTR